MPKFEVLTFKVREKKPKPVTKPALYRRGACDRCLARKIKCDGREPCAKCLSQAVACAYSFITRQPPKRTRPRKLKNVTAPASATATATPSSASTAPVAATTKTPTSNDHPVPLPTPLLSVPGPPIVSSPATLQHSQALSVVRAHSSGPAARSAAPTGTASVSLTGHIIALIEHLQLGDNTMDPTALSGLPFPNTLTPARSSDGSDSHYDESSPRIDPMSVDFLLGRATSPVPSMPPSPIPSPLWYTQRAQVAMPNPRSATQLQSQEEILYHPVLVHAIISTYVHQQTRIYRDLYLQRIYRKLQNNQISPLALNYILAYGLAITMMGKSKLPHAVRKQTGDYYIHRFDRLLMAAIDRPTLELPHLAFMIAAACMATKSTRLFTHYTSIGRELLLQMQFHLTDFSRHGPLPTNHPHPAATAPTPEFLGCSPVSDPGLAHHVMSVESDDELTREYKRRVFWDVLQYENMIHLLVGLPSSVNRQQSHVNAVDDRLVEAILRLPPEQDHYPVVIPGIRHTLSGYTPLTEFIFLIGEIADLRAHVCPLGTQYLQVPVQSVQEYYAANPNDRNPIIHRYYSLNDRLRQWYDALPEAFALPEHLPLDDQLIHRYPVHYSSIFTLHSNYHMAVLFLNLYNWNLVNRQAASKPSPAPTSHYIPTPPGSSARSSGSDNPHNPAGLLPKHHFPVFRPELDPVCHELGLTSAHLFTSQCLPFFQKLPQQYFSTPLLGSFATVALKYALYLRDYRYYHPDGSPSPQPLPRLANRPNSNVSICPVNSSPVSSSISPGTTSCSPPPVSQFSEVLAIVEDYLQILERLRDHYSAVNLIITIIRDHLPDIVTQRARSRHRRPDNEVHSS
ncbi:hypothetical protein H4R35_006370 [Dimargaris xerosporica]|nr:hypothetical protein H4R35_006370 [Dimargaris xerosporica]